MIATLAKRARAVIPGRARRDGEKAIAELRKLEARRLAIKQSRDNAVELLQDRIARAARAEGEAQEALESGDAQKVNAALDQLGRESGCLDFCKRYILVWGAMQRDNFDIFKSEHPQAKAVLLAAAKARLMEAKEKAAAAVAESRQNSDSITKRQCVDDANRRVSMLETMLIKIESEPTIDTTWPAYAEHLS
jgi:hypothetical protein